MGVVFAKFDENKVANLKSITVTVSSRIPLIIGDSMIVYDIQGVMNGVGVKTARMFVNVPTVQNVIM